jgi:hypothetical protein
MPKRRKAGVKKTLLCATRFWSIDWRTKDNRIATLRAGVRKVVRTQGYTSKQIDKAERDLVREGKLEIGGRGTGKTLRLTDKGNRVGCRTVKLSPWTDSPRAANTLLEGPRRRRRR